ncbi:uncharacterized protein [Amphiura filiformis]|uniref:uncharacterized protein n=1 Tax=Amphiura filiformis TaxID=82378 RepID=UPI003B20EBD6
MSAYKFLGAFVCIAALALGISADGHDRGDMGRPMGMPLPEVEEPEGARCCLPDDQFRVLKGSMVSSTRTGFFGKLSGPTKIFEYSDNVYDYTNNKFASYITRVLLDGSFYEEHVQVIENPDEDFVWVINLDEMKCMKGKKEEYPFRIGERCVPDYAMYSGAFYLGKEEFTANEFYQIIPEDMSTSGLFTFSVSPDCIPHSENFVGKTDSWGMSQILTVSSTFTNYTVGIDMPEKYFTVPDYCRYMEESKPWWMPV